MRRSFAAVLAAGRLIVGNLPAFARGITLLLIALQIAGCSSAHVVSSRDIGAAPAAAPAIVYVSDFDLDEANVTSEGLLPSLRPGILPSGPLGILRSPQASARDTVELMTKSLIDDLGDAGIEARRLPRQAAPPASGWLVRGAFLAVDTGNRLRRAVIGFGSGQTDLQVATAIDDLTVGPPAPFYALDTDAESGKLPGAVVTLNPYVAAARFVLAGGDLDRNVRETAKKIAGAIVARVKSGEKSATP